MPYRWPILFALLLLAAGRGAHAQTFVTGTQLAQACASRYPTGERDCDGYIAGVLDAAEAVPELKRRLCLPPSTRLATLREALGTFGEQHAEAARGSGVALLQSMIKANYPCPAQ